MIRPDWFTDLLNLPPLPPPCPTCGAGILWLDGRVWRCTHCVFPPPGAGYRVTASPDAPSLAGTYDRDGGGDEPDLFAPEDPA